MAILSGTAVAAKLIFLDAIKGDDLWVALYDASATLSPLTDAYTPAGEVKGQGYKAGGQPLKGYKSGIDGITACITWDSMVWPNATINARGAMIYNRSRQNAAVTVVDFGQDVISTNGNWKLPMPALGATTAVIRMS